VGEHTKKIFRLGDPVRVRLEEVNRERRQIDFVLDRESGKKKRPGKKAGKK
jgi:ribonuclease R